MYGRGRGQMLQHGDSRKRPKRVLRPATSASPVPGRRSCPPSSNFRPAQPEDRTRTPEHCGPRRHEAVHAPRSTRFVRPVGVRVPAGASRQLVPAMSLAPGPTTRRRSWVVTAVKLIRWSSTRCLSPDPPSDFGAASSEFVMLVLIAGRGSSAGLSGCSAWWSPAGPWRAAGGWSGGSGWGVDGAGEELLPGVLPGPAGW
jgi:hypothetical protein